LLHLLYILLEHNRIDKFNSTFLFKLKEIKDTFITYTADSTIKVLINKTNIKLKIYLRKGEVYNKVTRRKDIKLNKIFKEKKTYLRLEDLIKYFYNILERIIEH